MCVSVCVSNNVCARGDGSKCVGGVWWPKRRLNGWVRWFSSNRRKIIYSKIQLSKHFTMWLTFHTKSHTLYGCIYIFKPRRVVCLARLSSPNNLGACSYCVFHCVYLCVSISVRLGRWLALSISKYFNFHLRPPIKYSAHSQGWCFCVFFFQDVTSVSYR